MVCVPTPIPSLLSVLSQQNLGGGVWRHNSSFWAEDGTSAVDLAPYPSMSTNFFYALGCVILLLWSCIFFPPGGWFMQYGGFHFYFFPHETRVNYSAVHISIWFSERTKSLIKIYLHTILTLTNKYQLRKDNLNLALVYFAFLALSCLKLQQTNLLITQSVLLLHWIYCFPPLDGCFIFLNMHHFNTTDCYSSSLFFLLISVITQCQYVFGVLPVLFVKWCSFFFPRLHTKICKS